ncbi:hypothetical protein OUZ56_000594 [Daphnia magna]|uniref:Uncharacterized protein n=1 Tax=Daphnia magna TaxID=35525 RepID=A0ABR0A091_9CRUS|nr:hypothetical protein OUZ56_000594 [Daphnia magna]
MIQTPRRGGGRVDKDNGAEVVWSVVALVRACGYCRRTANSYGFVALRCSLTLMFFVKDPPLNTPLRKRKIYLQTYGGF